jgi:hypothetical protein
MCIHIATRNERTVMCITTKTQLVSGRASGILRHPPGDSHVGIPGTGFRRTLPELTFMLQRALKLRRVTNSSGRLLFGREQCETMKDQ